MPNKGKTYAGRGKAEKQPAKEKAAVVKEKKRQKEEEFEVEKIITKHSAVNGKHYYLISWKGYGDAHNSWEPKENIDDELVASFEQSLKNGAIKKPTRRQLEQLPLLSSDDGEEAEPVKVRRRKTAPASNALGEKQKSNKKTDELPLQKRKAEPPAAQENVEAAEEVEDQEVQCLFCKKMFTVAVLKNHAGDCLEWALANDIQFPGREEELKIRADAKREDKEKAGIRENPVQIVGRGRILVFTDSVVGEGGNSKVLSGYDRKTNEELAILLEVRKPGESKHEFTARKAKLHENVKTMAGAKYVIPFRGMVTVSVDGTPMLGYVMPKFGQDARTVYGRMGDYLPFSTKKHHMLYIAEGLIDFHRRGVIHGDVQPMNVLINRDEAKLCDLGSATKFPIDMLATNGDMDFWLMCYPPEAFPEHATADEDEDAFIVDELTEAFAGGQLFLQMLHNDFDKQFDKDDEATWKNVPDDARKTISKLISPEKKDRITLSEFIKEAGKWDTADADDEFGDSDSDLDDQKQDDRDSGKHRKDSHQEEGERERKPETRKKGDGNANRGNKEDGRINKRGGVLEDEEMQQKSKQTNWSLSAIKGIFGINEAKLESPGEELTRKEARKVLKKELTELGKTFHEKGGAIRMPQKQMSAIQDEPEDLPTAFSTGFSFAKVAAPSTVIRQANVVPHHSRVVTNLDQDLDEFVPVKPNKICTSTSMAKQAIQIESQTGAIAPTKQLHEVSLKSNTLAVAADF